MSALLMPSVVASDYVPFKTITPPPPMASEGPDGAEAARSAARPAGLPCREVNNCTQTELSQITTYHRKVAFALGENVRLLVERHTIERIGFLTLTFAENIQLIKEAQKRFHSLRTHVLTPRYLDHIAVVQRMPRTGRIHFHLVVAMKEDIRTGLDFLAVARRDYRSANPVLRAEWAFWRRTAPEFRFGRTELLPVKSTAGAMGTYIAGYIGKHVNERREEDRGARMVRYSKGVCKCTSRFGWVSVKGWLWRAKCEKWADNAGVTEADVALRIGPHWAYDNREEILATELAVYPDARHARANGEELPPDIPDDAKRIVFQNRLSIEKQTVFYEDRMFFKDGVWWRDGCPA